MELKKEIEYNKNTGKFKWLIRKRGRSMKKEPGYIMNTGYRMIEINKKHYLAHRLAWFYVNGEWPEYHIDHINHDRADNRIENLREVSQKENARNRTISTKNTSGTTGVYWHKTKGKWTAGITIDSKFKHIGEFNNINDAIAARKSAEKLYGFHENHGK